MAQPIHINSTSQFEDILKQNTHVIVDFHATWCGPCHMIAPVYQKLSAQTSKAGQVAFTKVDVDEQQELAAKYGITAMPTFLVIKNGEVTETIRGANPPVLTKAVLKAKEEAEKIAKSKPEKVEETKGTEETVSGSYGMSAGSGWKTSLQ